MPGSPRPGVGTTNPRRAGVAAHAQPPVGVGSTNPRKRGGYSGGPVSGLLGVYDTSGALSTQADMTPPPGAIVAVIRCQGGGGGRFLGGDPFGANPRHVIASGASGGAFAKATVALPAAAQLTTVGGWGSYRGRGVALSGSTVCFAETGQDATSTGGAVGGDRTHCLGDVVRYGGRGGSSGTNTSAGGSGSSGEAGGNGAPGSYSSCTACDAGGNSVTQGAGGDGGSGGDFGDADGIGFGWDPTTGVQRQGNSPDRVTIHFYANG